MHPFLEIHHDLPREAPGSDQSTRRALELVRARLPAAPQILDIGCGPGAQSIVLANATGGRVTALDIHQPFLDSLQARTRAEGLADRIDAVQDSLFAMSFPDESFDLLWAEGSLFIIGLERGLIEWRHLLTPEGFIAFTEPCWLTERPPDAARDFWEEQYPEMRTVAANLEILRRLDYTLVGHFTLPEEDWWEGYYNPLGSRIAELRERHREDPEWQAALANEEREIELYRSHSESYGYEFFVLGN